MSKVYIGVDPGASGGLAAIGASVCAVGMPDTERDIWYWFTDNLHVSVTKIETFAVIEKVGGYIGDKQPGSAMFKFGYSAGFLQGCLVASGIPFEMVTPQKWQKGLGIPSRKKDESKTNWKNRLKTHAQRLFPKEKVTLATADALLISEYCRRKQEGKL